MRWPSIFHSEEIGQAMGRTNPLAAAHLQGSLANMANRQHGAVQAIPPRRFRKTGQPKSFRNIDSQHPMGCRLSMLYPQHTKTDTRLFRSGFLLFTYRVSSARSPLYSPRPWLKRLSCKMFEDLIRRRTSAYTTTVWNWDIP